MRCKRVCISSEGFQPVPVIARTCQPSKSREPYFNANFIVSLKVLQVHFLSWCLSLQVFLNEGCFGDVQLMFVWFLSRILKKTGTIKTDSNQIIHCYSECCFSYPTHCMDRYHVESITRCLNLMKVKALIIYLSCIPFSTLRDLLLNVICH